jgi:hypothetical protein
MFEGVNHEGSVAMLPVLAGKIGFELNCSCIGKPCEEKNIILKER